MQHAPIPPHPLMIVPFGVLLAAIALAPLFFSAWWGRHYPKIAIGLAAVTVCYYAFVLQNAGRLTHTAAEYISFMSLIGSLYVVSGGIHITVKGEATPFENVLFLLAGALIANLLGTTGASMLLIRPWIRMNKYRITGHHIVFFIFIVANVGGCLTPIGDPPLFLGYLKGVPFWWVAEHCWPIWLTAIMMLLATFYAVDRWNFMRAPKAVRAALAEPPDQFRFQGTLNLFFLAVILLAVFVEKPVFLREGLMLAAAAGSYFTTRKTVHAANDFNFHPVKEVAILFVGIFATMIPALDWLQANAATAGTAGPAFYYWGSGVLSSILDNAPTYLSFLTAIFGSSVPPEIVSQVHQMVQAGGEMASLAGPQGEQIRNTFLALQKYHAAQVTAKTVTTDEIQVAFLVGNAAFNRFIVAVSVGAVFFGANTYIGNGPNFMVKAIADQQKVHTPNFLAYIFKYTLPYMLPMLAIVWWFFFR